MADSHDGPGETNILRLQEVQTNTDNYIKVEEANDIDDDSPTDDEVGFMMLYELLLHYQ